MKLTDIHGKPVPVRQTSLQLLAEALEEQELDCIEEDEYDWEEWDDNDWADPWWNKELDGEEEEQGSKDDTGL